ncbi:MAG: hypothetical protein WBE79_04265 [Candidatus Cybelea sp.]
MLVERPSSSCAKPLRRLRLLAPPAHCFTHRSLANGLAGYFPANGLAGYFPPNGLAGYFPPNDLAGYFPPNLLANDLTDHRASDGLASYFAADFLANRLANQRRADGFSNSPLSSWFCFFRWRQAAVH